MAEMHVSLPFFMSGIYIHIPFCREACHYCDFHFSTNVEIKEALVQAIGEELRLRQGYLGGRRVDTIYFGGGTPSLLSTSELRFLLETVFQTHDISPDAEITMETNPDDLTLAALSEYKALGINRLSVGIQSFDDPVLKFLNRVHSSETAIRSVDRARQAGFENISIDLIYAIPGLSSNAWKENIARAVSLGPPHISAYTLTIEERTVFGNWQAKGKLKAVDEASAAAQLEMLMKMLTEAGYRQYEISNFARPGRESKHNSSYWRGVPYLGVGPSAHSYDTTSRQHNVANNHQYVRALKEKNIPAEVELLTRQDRINDYILTTLRTDSGCDLSELKRAFSYDLVETEAAYIRNLEQHHLITLAEGRLRLTDKGKLLADKIASDLFLLR